MIRWQWRFMASLYLTRWAVRIMPPPAKQVFQSHIEHFVREVETVYLEALEEWNKRK
jgi:hypothetical protein